MGTAVCTRTEGFLWHAGFMSWAQTAIRAQHNGSPSALLCLHSWKQPLCKGIYSPSVSSSGEEPGWGSLGMGLAVEPSLLKAFFFFNWSYSHNIKVCLWDGPLCGP